MSHWNVADVMTVGAISVQRDTPFRQIVDIMELHNINAVPVVDAADHVIGLVSSADLMSKIEYAGNHGRALFERQRVRAARVKSTGTAAGDLMTTPVVTVSARTSLVAAAKVMDEGRLKRLPVVDQDGRLVGMVTRRDLLKVFLRPDKQIRAEIVDEVLDGIAGVEPTQVTVDVGDGVVTLLGEVDRRSLLPVVRRLVERVDGVVDVVSHLTYAVDDTRQPPAGVASGRAY
ncbi:MAG TPA: CBS domain-containing protein [Rugosimonospora sp.]|nr:CBS domain-containing protein [Rugosimonospora sp.]